MLNVGMKDQFTTVCKALNIVADSDSLGNPRFAGESKNLNGPSARFRGNGLSFSALLIETGSQAVQQEGDIPT